MRRSTATIVDLIKAGGGQAGLSDAGSPGGKPQDKLVAAREAVAAKDHDPDESTVDVGLAHLQERTMVGAARQDNDAAAMRAIT